MAHLVKKVIGPEASRPKLNARTYTVEGKNQLPQAVLGPRRVLWQVSSPPPKRLFPLSFFFFQEGKDWV